MVSLMPFSRWRPSFSGKHAFVAAFVVSLCASKASRAQNLAALSGDSGGAPSSTRMEVLAPATLLATPIPLFDESTDFVVSTRASLAQPNFQAVPRVWHEPIKPRFFTVAAPITSTPTSTPSTSAANTLPVTARGAQSSVSQKSVAQSSVTPSGSTSPVSSSAVPANAAANAPANAPATSAASVIAINVNGRAVMTNPAAVLQAGSVLVPLRGVLENLGATISFNSQTRGIVIVQGTRRVVLLLDSRDATANGKAIRLTAAPQLIGGSAFVPLRALAQIFGYDVQWIAANNLVSIQNASGVVLPNANHRQALKTAGQLGVGISFVEGNSTVSMVDADRLLDAAKDAGASLIKVRFDWGILEPTRGAAFQWPFYDHVILGARRRGLTVEGVLGQSSQWASTFFKASDPEQWRNGAPRATEMKSWQNYVKRVVGRYKNDVQAWQVWEKTSADRFRSSQNVYRQFLLGATEAARIADPNAVLFAAEPGGLDLDVIDSLSHSQAAPLLDGVAIYPVSQNQPGSVAPTGDFLRPYATLLTDPYFRGSATHPFHDFWIGGLSCPVLSDDIDNNAAVANASVADASTSSTGNMVQVVPVSIGSNTNSSVANNGTSVSPLVNAPPIATDDADTRARLLQTFTAQAQANYLMQSSVLALAAGSDKVFWSDLRDRADYESIAPINAEYNAGLLRRDFSSRPSFSAFKTLATQVKGKKYIGSLALGPDIVALVFDDGTDASVAAWTTQGTAQLVINPAGQNPGVPNSLYVASAATTQVLDAAGNVLASGQVNATLTTRPIWITHIAYETRAAIRKPQARGVLLDSSTPTFVAAQGVSADFGSAGNESGLYWRKFSQFRGAANKIVKVGDRSGLMTEVSRNILDPAAGKFFIFLDVDDDYLYLTRDVPVEVTITVKRPALETQTLVTSTAGFNLEYPTPGGTGRTSWQVVDAGSDWATYTFTLPDASFSNRGGYDLLLNTFGSKKDLVFGSVAVRRLSAG